MKQNIVISENLERSLVVAISECQHDRVFVLTDETTKRLCWPKLSSMRCMQEVTLITIPATDTNKNLESLALVWDALSKGGATRHSLLINLGGGMVTDLGGFAAATFKRGIDFINIPTTLLAMVDASVGGKTGVNFNGLKNEIGVFADARFVIISTLFLDTLDMPNLCSGYAEMLKHGLINDERMWAELVGFSLHNPDFAQLQRMVGESIAVKERIVQQDPHEKDCVRLSISDIPSVTPSSRSPWSRVGRCSTDMPWRTDWWASFILAYARQRSPSTVCARQHASSVRLTAHPPSPAMTIPSSSN